MRAWRRVAGVGAGIWLAILPVAAFAQAETRAVERTDDWVPVMIVTFAAMIATMLIATLGYLYRRRRNLVWDFQQPEEATHSDAH